MKPDEVNENHYDKRKVSLKFISRPHFLCYQPVICLEIDVLHIRIDNLDS